MDLSYRPRAKSKSATLQKSIVRTLAGATIIVLGLLAFRQIERTKLERAAKSRAFREARITSIPDTAHSVKVQLKCSLMFCNINIRFIDEQINIKAWVGKSGEWATAPHKVLRDGIHEYTLPKSPGQSLSPTIWIDGEQGLVTLDVSIDGMHCTDLCGEWW
jgi:hypothetical protein